MSHYDGYLKDFICGLGAAVVNTSATFPINKLIYRQILGDDKLLHAFNTIRKEGPFYLYRGCLPLLVQKAVSLSTMFGVYNSVQIPLKKYGLNEYVEKIFASCASGILETFFMPFERMQVLMVHREYNQRFKNMYHALRELKVHYGYKEYYRGINLICMRNIGSNCCFFLTKGEIQKLPAINDSKLKEGVRDFFSGGLLGLTMSVIFYPTKVMKICVHKKLGGRHFSVYEIALLVYRKNGGGVKNFYRGVLINGCRSLLNWGITNMVFEFLRKVI
ncbi:hypothetical protein JTB14_007349 [Gonioctena quinquepunctata]|nr:hypothetical protein JTB14_007349 [Gonioctena quinquepunctata]